jgi:hypothetical protein
LEIIQEAVCDYYACTINDDPNFGEWIKKPIGKPLRVLDNDMKYPDDWAGFNHNSTQIFSGALWDLREFFGQEEMDRRVMRTMKQEPENMAEFIEKFLTVDDDNNNLGDGTPHITEICQAFYLKHGLFCDYCTSSLAGIPEAIITSPPYATVDAAWEGEGQNMFITGPIPIKGTVLGSTATINPFCKIEFADVRPPDQWLTEGIVLNEDIVSEPVTDYSGTIEPVTDQVLATWDISGIPNGIYKIRLTVSDEQGSDSATSITHVGITPEMHEGWPKSLTWLIYDSPGYDNLDATDPDLEIAVCSDYLVTLNADGSQYWTPAKNLGSLARSSPAIGDIDVDGELDIVIGTTDNQMIYAYGGDGSLKWSDSLGGCTHSTPALGNVNTDDDELEIVIGADNGMVYVYGHDGAVEGAYPVIGKVRSSPALGDIDNDNLLEIVVCSGEDVVENGVSTENQHIYVLEHDGTQKWHTVTGEPTGHSSPVLADVDLDNELEIVVSNIHKTYVFEAEGGQPLISEEYANNPWSPSSFPVVGNIDSDPELEVVVSTGNGVWAFNHDMSAIEGWNPLIIPYVMFGEHAALLVNLDDDPQLEIIVQIYRPSELYAFNLDGSIVNGWPKVVYYNTNNSSSENSYPAIGDIDNDGYLEIIACYSVGAIMYVYDLDVPANDDFYNNAWPMFRYNAERTGLYE